MLSVAFYSSSSSEDEEAVSILELNTVRKQLRQQTNIFTLPNKKFISYFRLNKDAFKYVLNKISHKMQDPKRNTAVSKLIKLTATMRILAEGSYQKGAGNDHYVNLCQTTVSESFNECIEAMYSELCPRWISFEVDEAKQNEIKRHFYRKTGFPGVIGCIDGTHVSIIPPPVVDRFKYLNRKGFYSLNVLLACDHRLRISYIQTHSPGSSHDSLIWNISDLKHHLKQRYENGEKNTRLLGDAGYPLKPYLITPFRLAHQGSPESNFNEIHSRTRNVAERCIGVLKNRFRCLLGARQLHYSPEFAGKITAVCAALHNISLHFNIEWPEIDVSDEITHDCVDEDNLVASNIRQKIMEQLI